MQCDLDFRTLWMWLLINCNLHSYNLTFTIYLNGSVDQSWEKPPNYWKNKHWCDVSNWAGSSQVRSIEHSHTIVKILQNVVFTSHAVMMTLNKIDEIAPSPRNFVLLTRPQGSSRPAFFTSRPLKSYSSYFIVSILFFIITRNNLQLTIYIAFQIFSYSYFRSSFRLL